jgi:undecaprenyl diphosphate synthase
MNPLNHVAIIMDGNGRWGLKHKNSRNEGHRAGLNTIENILKRLLSKKLSLLPYLLFLLKIGIDLKKK